MSGSAEKLHSDRLVPQTLDLLVRANSPAPPRSLRPPGATRKYLRHRKQGSRIITTEAGEILHEDRESHRLCLPDDRHDVGSTRLRSTEEFIFVIILTTHII